jgi:CRISPR-associated endonuclease Csy4
LLGALFGKFHQAIVQLRADDIGVSFPQYSTNPRGLGGILRLHGTQSSLQRLMQHDWLKGIRDHVRMADVSAVPDTAEHRVVTRKQFKTSAERLRRRRMKRKGESAEQAVQAIPDEMERKPDLPFIRLRSQSTGQGFHLFIALGPPLDEPVAGSFNAYGLGGPATIPWF